ncbi:MAG TPA: GNAT family N-acetyltransferase [Gaiellaceae bacterium]|nr:GNAT family N-acetyltransferase [Gaiellaceae bacterium]
MVSRSQAVRSARPEDSEAVADVFLAARAAAMPYLPDLHTAEETRAWIRHVVLAEHEVRVVEAEGAVAGFVALGPKTVEHLYVRPELKGRGIGVALLDVAKELRPHGFRLWVFQRNVGARRFYERHGLHVVELTDGAANEEREPDALYEWRPLSRARPGRPSTRAAP